MTFKEKMKAVRNILFKNKPIGSIEYGINFTRCSECEYKLRCDECVFKAENETLKNEIGKEFTCFVGDPHKVEYCPYLEELKTAKSEAVKEFAERLCEGRVSNDPVVIAVKVELKEMVGED